MVNSLKVGAININSNHITEQELGAVLSVVPPAWNLIKVLWSFAGVSPELVKVRRSWSKFAGISQSSIGKRRTRLSSLKFQVELEGCYPRRCSKRIQEKKTWFVLPPFLF
ncbi:unnamed protein product [Cuscuta epithymum]|uniref:Uncharacterized protein n=1 Tax=Cuscuta epithymum TaxID=186058 RepID=A0AAV0CJH2_9ASTE|nr:unnamed protein product [Cuscuta epithymum]